jgi:hypothetical protein
MKLWTIPIFTLILVACTAPIQMERSIQPTPIPSASPLPTLDQSKPAMQSAYPDLGPAPELAGDIWLNSESPLHLPDLRGKVVLVDMWTFG